MEKKILKNSISVFIILSIIGCQQINQNKVERAKVEEAILNATIIKHLDEMITTKDSLENASSIYSHHNSYWISFYDLDSSEYTGKCYVRLMANFSYYHKNEIIGFLKYRNKVIIFYDSESICNQGIVNIKKLNTEKEEIDFLDNYDDVLVPPHEPTIIDFEIIGSGEVRKKKVRN